MLSTPRVRAAMKTSETRPVFFRLLVAAGGTALFGAVLVEMMAIVGRLIGSPLPGSIEIVQVLVAVAGTVALIMATYTKTHACVRLITGRLKGRVAVTVARLNNLLGMVFFLLLCAGSIWIASDLWLGMEESEIWRLPYKPLRIMVVAGTLCVAGLFLYHSLGSGDKH